MKKEYARIKHRVILFCLAISMLVGILTSCEFYNDLIERLEYQNTLKNARLIWEACYDESGDDHIWVMKEDGSDKTRITFHYRTHEREYVLSPNRKKIAYIQYLQEIATMYIDGSDKKIFRDHEYDVEHINWSPDGEKLYYEDYSGDDAEICVMNVNCKGNTYLTNNDGIGDYYPCASPDGKKIAFERYGEIYVMNVDGTEQVSLTENAAFDYRPCWSPDGSRLYFLSTRDGNREIYVMNADGTGQTNLSQNGANDTQIVLSSDGKKVAFISDRDGNDEIYAMNIDGTSQINLTENAAIDTEPSWRPDGERIAFVSFRDGDSEIFVMNADGSHQIQLTENTGMDTTPGWLR
jgi:Tol biopolymer transport system component